MSVVGVLKIIKVYKINNTSPMYLYSEVNLYLCFTMEEFDALDVIARTRGKVKMDEVPTGDSIFLVWGWPTAVCFLLEFLLWRWLEQEWCMFLWVAIPMVGMPLMKRIVRKDYDRTHIRSLKSKLILDYWIFAGSACCIGGFALGFGGLEKICFLPVVSLLIGIGSFLTGEVTRFRPMVVCGLVGASLGILSALFQGEWWSWQLLAVAIVGAVALIIPGYLYNKRFKDGV